jgi:hypothetical protein
MAKTTTSKAKAAAARPSAAAKKSTTPKSTTPKSTTPKSTTPKSTTPKSTTPKQKGAVARTADLSEEVLKTVEAGQRAAIEAVRHFVDTVDEALPAIGDRPSHRETLIDAALDMADKLVTTQYDFLRSIMRSADRSLSKPGATKK